ncbi:MAG TPA: hotdog domain-containing protein [Acidimicrobiales bacterium]|nr:hotdog domain-containing protein [Acidimicrobiales bacterium]
MLVESGVHGQAELVVADEDTAIAAGSGDVPVLATPRVLALCEEAACAAIADRLGPDETTVGLRIELTHIAPTRVGSRVQAEATLDRTEGRRLVFTVSVSDACGLVAAGKLTRAVVDRASFLDKAR